MLLPDIECDGSSYMSNLNLKQIEANSPTNKALGTEKKMMKKWNPATWAFAGLLLYVHLWH